MADLPTRHSTVVYTGHQNGWNSATDDNGSYALDDAWLAVFGDNANVTFLGTGDQVSFNAPSTAYYTETVVGSGGEISVVHAHVTVTGIDDLIYFDPSDDVLNLSGAGWSTLYASSGVANLSGASLNVIGGGVTINALSGDNAVSLYQTGGVGDTVNGDHMIVTLTNAQATLNGADDTIWFVGGSASVVTLNPLAGGYGSVYCAGTVRLQDGAVNWVGGGALVDFLNPGGVAYLSYTQGLWDQVEGAAGTVVLSNAQAVVEGGNQTVQFLAGYYDDAVTITQTNGNWDSIYTPSGYDVDVQRINVVSAQVNIFGYSQNIYASGAGTEISLYIATGGYSDFAVHGSNVEVIANGGSSASVIGGANIIFATDASAYTSLALSDTNGAWDVVYDQSHQIALDNAQASIIGGGNEIDSEVNGTFSVSLYDTAGADDTMYSDSGTVTLTNAGVSVYASDDFVSFDGGTNAVDVSRGSATVLGLTGRFGLDTVSGFNSTDSLTVSGADFTDFQAFQHALSQQGDDTVLTLDADDKVAFTGLQTSAITAAQVKFV